MSVTQLSRIFNVRLGVPAFETSRPIALCWLISSTRLQTSAICLRLHYHPFGVYWAKTSRYCSFYPKVRQRQLLRCLCALSTLRIYTHGLAWHLAAPHQRTLYILTAAG